MTEWECGLCMITCGRDRVFGGREAIREHLRDHDLREDSIDTYLTRRSGQQATLSTVTDGGSERTASTDFERSEGTDGE